MPLGAGDLFQDTLDLCGERRRSDRAGQDPETSSALSLSIRNKRLRFFEEVRPWREFRRADS